MVSFAVATRQEQMIPRTREWIEDPTDTHGPVVRRFRPRETCDDRRTQPVARLRWTSLVLAMLLLISGVFTGASSAWADVRTPRHVRSRPRRPTRLNPPRSVAPTTSPAARTSDPCSIIPSRLAAVALGADPGPSDATTVLNGGQCSYGNDIGGIIVTIVRGPSALGKSAKDAVNEGNARALSALAEDPKPDVIYNTLPGIGDGAFVIGTGSSPDKAFTSASLAFYAGDTMVTILLSFHPATRNPVTEIISLAKSVAPSYHADPSKSGNAGR